MTIQNLRTILVKQGQASITTHHTALLVVPQETTWQEDIEWADVYGVDSAEEEREVRSLPNCWEPAGRIGGDEYAKLTEDENSLHEWD